MILRDPTVDVAVLETARGGILREGLAFDRCDVGAVLNVKADHLGLRGIGTLAQLAEVKRIVVEVAREAGITAFERNFSLTDVYGADEAFTTGTFAGVAPVGTIDGRIIGTERGAIVERLQQLYRKRLEQDVAGRQRP